MTRPDTGSSRFLQSPLDAPGRRGRNPLTHIELDGVGRLFGRGETAVWAVRDVDLTAERGEFLFVKGPSGAGDLPPLKRCQDMTWIPGSGGHP